LINLIKICKIPEMARPLRRRKGILRQRAVELFYRAGGSKGSKIGELF
jgi:hypothetical protein